LAGTYHISLNPLERRIYIENYSFPPLGCLPLESCTGEPGRDIFHFKKIAISRRRVLRISICEGDLHMGNVSTKNLPG
jgi:hypothetical protein